MVDEGLTRPAISDGWVRFGRVDRVIRHELCIENFTFQGCLKLG